MKRIIKNAIKRLADTSVALSGRTALGRHLHEQIIRTAMQQRQQVNHRGVNLLFATPSAMARFRANTFSTKEPETLEWIDGIAPGSVLWDIGANVGLYSCYAAKARGCRVFAFEPSVFNLELLARNVFLNGLKDLITLVPLPLSDELARSCLNMTSTDWGAALSTFNQGYGHDGQPIRKVFEFPTIGLSMVDAVRLLQVPQPDYVKMDVDGIEHLILKGGLPVLRNVSSVLVEINEQFAAQRDLAASYLTEAGLTFDAKRHAAYFDSYNGSEKYTYNQLWIRRAGAAAT